MCNTTTVEQGAMLQNLMPKIYKCAYKARKLFAPGKPSQNTHLDKAGIKRYSETPEWWCITQIWFSHTHQHYTIVEMLARTNTLVYC
jgi:hypothetical protein